MSPGKVSWESWRLGLGNYLWASNAMEAFASLHVSIWTGHTTKAIRTQKERRGGIWRKAFPEILKALQTETCLFFLPNLSSFFKNHTKRIGLFPVVSLNRVDLVLTSSPLFHLNWGNIFGCFHREMWIVFTRKPFSFIRIVRAYSFKDRGKREIYK